jgi:hypothetical protein
MDKRFWAKVQKTDGCWLWTGALASGYGYFGRMTPNGPKNFLAHRIAYEQLVGLIPAGLVIDHLCRNRRCVNPAHMEPVTIRENLLRGESPPAQNARRTHCKYGHEYTKENTSVYHAKRFCLTCRKINNHRRYEQRKLRAIKTV